MIHHCQKTSSSWGASHLLSHEQLFPPPSPHTHTRPKWELSKQQLQKGLEQFLPLDSPQNVYPIMNSTKTPYAYFCYVEKLK